ncbi:hypothetical protein BKA70DRAFT_1239172 [Coprinopsis sp. MPI-PUGE-AT-0042]|nr:hypothetical protein BKA70DRAFT_1239172 [Coprinopsis sp. MPI-PUGE-AT-0042]
MPPLQEGPEHEAADPRPGVNHKSGGAPSDASPDGHHSEGTDSDDPELGLSDKEAQELEMESEAEPEDDGWAEGPSKPFTRQSRVQKGAKPVEILADHEREQEEPADIMDPVGPPLSSAGKRGKLRDAGRVSNSLVSEGERGESINEDQPLDGPGPSTLRRDSKMNTQQVWLATRATSTASAQQKATMKVYVETLLQSPVRFLIVGLVKPARTRDESHHAGREALLYRATTTSFPESPVHRLRSMQSKRASELCEGTTNHAQTVTNYVINPLKSKTLVLARSADVAGAEGAKDLFTKRLQQHLFPRLIRMLLAEADSALEEGHLGSLSALRDPHAEVDSHQDLPPMPHWPVGYVKLEMDQIVNHEDIAFQCAHGAPRTTIQEQSTVATGRRTDNGDLYVPFRIHGNFRANSVYTGPGALDPQFRQFDILWLQHHVVTDRAAAFDSLVLPVRLCTRGNMTVLVDPTDVRYSCHLIRGFIPDPELDGLVYYVNGYTDRDSMTMQTVSRNHRSPNLPCIKPATEDYQSNLRLVFVETPGDNPQQRSALVNIPTGTLCAYGKPGDD